ncbi:MAG: hypothetical protein Ct9H90mP22_1720 [Gammaproteobacteria bacterium]|nr:MAG: hypothetical protein Ct9H90mP22_1720 [Gammaproteobacteria bacterium]
MNPEPLKKNITSEEVGNAAAFLCSDLARDYRARFFMLMQDLTSPLWVIYLKLIDKRI